MRERSLMTELDSLVSEGRNPATMDIDLLPTAALLQRISDADRMVPVAVAQELPAIERAVDSIVAAFGRGGRLIYVGAGTSGRLGVLDASECPPTFGVADDMVVGLIAGGRDALVRSIEGAEDSSEAGAKALRDIALRPRDIVVGIAASGRTPYVIGAMTEARRIGATTIGLSCNPGSTLARMADIAISPVVGPEVLTGSTRMKSGTAQKMVLNMLTTASMIRIGKAYENLMVDLAPTNRKLMARATRMVAQVTGCDTDAARTALDRSGHDVKLAILMQITGHDIDTARRALAAAGGFLRVAISAWRDRGHPRMNQD